MKLAAATAFLGGAMMLAALMLYHHSSEVATLAERRSSGGLLLRRKKQQGHTDNEDRSLVILGGGGFVPIGNTIQGAIISGEGDALGIAAFSRDGSTLAVGAPFGGANNEGYVEIYSQTDGGGGISWQPKGINFRFNGANAFDVFGGSISLSSNGNIIAIGAAGTEGGYTVVLEYDESSSRWVTRIVLIGPGAEAITRYDDNFGESVSLSGDGGILVVGAPRRRDPGSGIETGAVYTYERVGAAYQLKGNGEILPYIVAGDIGKFEESKFGESLAISEDATFIIVGASRYSSFEVTRCGRVVSFRFTTIPEGYFPFGPPIVGTVQSEGLGETVAVNQDATIIAMGSPGSNLGGSLTGKVQARQRVGEDWVPLGSAISGENNLDFFPRDLALSRDGFTLAVSSTMMAGGRNGRVRIFKFDGNDWILQRIKREPAGSLGLYDLNIDGGGMFGDSISLTGDANLVAIGAPEGGMGFPEQGEIEVWGQTDYPTFSPILNSLPQIGPSPTNENQGGNCFVTSIWQFVTDSAAFIQRAVTQFSNDENFR